MAPKSHNYRRLTDILLHMGGVVTAVVFFVALAFGVIFHGLYPQGGEMFAADLLNHSATRWIPGIYFTEASLARIQATYGGTHARFSAITPDDLASTPVDGQANDEHEATASADGRQSAENEGMAPADGLQMQSAADEGMTSTDDQQTVEAGDDALETSPIPDDGSADQNGEAATVLPTDSDTDLVDEFNGMAGDPLTSDGMEALSPSLPMIDEPPLTDAVPEITGIGFQVNASLATGEYANLRAEPALDAPVIGRLTRSDTLRVVGQTGNFYEAFQADTHCYVYTTTVTVRAERIELEAPVACTARADIQLATYALSENYRLHMNGTLTSDTPIQSVGVYVYDMRAFEVETFYVYELPEPATTFDVSALDTLLKSERLSGGEKRIYWVVNDGRSEAVAAEQTFYVLGPAKEPVHMTNLCAVSVSNGTAKDLLDANIATGWKPDRAEASVTIELPRTPAAAQCTLSWQVPPHTYTVALCDANDQVISETTLQTGFYLDTIVLPPAVASDADGETAMDDLFGVVRKIRIQTTDPRAVLATVRVYEVGKVARAVQHWQPVADQWDLMVVSAHQDDEFLFFGGTIPQAVARDKAVGVVYMADCGRSRYEEALDGLWTAGLQTHPIFMNFEDSRVGSIALAEKLWASKNPLPAMVTLIRRYRPSVIVTHDYNGEYGHNQHKYTVRLLEQAIIKAADATFDPASAELYGTWSTPKFYSHLSETNPITVDWDQPIGDDPAITPRLLATIAYDKHQSQQKYFSMAGDGVKYDNERFGLVHSTVGPDVERNDFFENIGGREEDER